MRRQRDLPVHRNGGLQSSLSTPASSSWLFRSCSRVLLTYLDVSCWLTPNFPSSLPKQKLTLNIAASHPGYPQFEHLLSPGWIPGRQVDNSDQQYASFRDNLPYLFLVLLLHPILRRGFESAFSGSDSSWESANGSSPNGRDSPYGLQSIAADQRFNTRINFDFLFGLVFLIALHGFSAPKVIFILYINYTIVTKVTKDYLPVATWVFNICILFANELARGYHYEAIASTIFPWGDSGEGGEHSNWGTYLDSYRGLIPRWEVLFNVTVLRLISFNMDYYWSLGQVGGSPIEVCHSIFTPFNLFNSLLMITRRSSSTPPISLSEIALAFQPRPRTSPFAITSLTHCTLHYTWQVQSSLLMTTFPNKDTSPEAYPGTVL